MGILIAEFENGTNTGYTSEIQSVTNMDRPDDETISVIFARADAAAQAEAQQQTPDEILANYFPSSSSSSTPASANARSSAAANEVPPVSQPTAPTSMSIHEHHAVPSNRATRSASTYDNSFFGLNSLAGDRSVNRHAATNRDLGMTAATAAWFGRLSALTKHTIYAGLIMLLVGAVVRFSGGRLSVAAVQKCFRHQKIAKPTFWNVYFPKLSNPSTIMLASMISVGVVWLFSLGVMTNTLQRVIKGKKEQRAAQIILLKNWGIWLLCSAADGMLRLRKREDIAVSMEVITVIFLALSYFTGKIALPSPEITHAESPMLQNATAG